MAIVVRFNATLVRKNAIAADNGNRVGGLRAYLREKRYAWHEDPNLLAVCSMSACDADDHLRREGLSEGADFCGANQVVGADSSVSWIEGSRHSGLAVCWLAGETPGYLVDAKPRRAMFRWAASKCPSCSRDIGLEAAAAAIALRERQEGPLAYIDLNPNSGDDWSLRCVQCLCESLATGAGIVAAARVFGTAPYLGH